jgi:8-oxo-dGTP diphosphatase
MSQLTSAVAAVIEDPAGRVLLCQQSQGHRMWGLPGGKIRLGEGPMHAAVRDVREEIGADVDIVDLVGLYQLSGAACGDDLPDVLVYVFRARIDGGATVNSPGRISRIAWYDPDILPAPVTATTRVAVADAAAGISGVLRAVEREPAPETPEAVEAPVPAQSSAYLSVR